MIQNSNSSAKKLDKTYLQAVLSLFDALVSIDSKIFNAEGLLDLAAFFFFIYVDKSIDELTF